MNANSLFKRCFRCRRRPRVLRSLLLKSLPVLRGEGGPIVILNRVLFSRSHNKRSIFCRTNNLLSENSNSMTLQFEKLINNLYAKRTIWENEAAKPAFFVVITERNLISSQPNNYGVLFWVCGWTPIVWAFNWNVNNTFAQYYVFQHYKNWNLTNLWNFDFDHLWEWKRKLFPKFNMIVLLRNICFRNKD